MSSREQDRPAGSRPAAPADRRWQKVLYVRQPYPDCHVDDTFLASLVTNANVQQYEYDRMVKATAVLVQQVSVLVIFFIVFSLVQHDTVGVGTIAGVNAALLAGLLTWLRCSGPRFRPVGLTSGLPEACKYVVIFLGVLLALAPILQTLTQAYCDDTIWAQTIFLSALHLLFHEYRVPASMEAGTMGTFSLNAAMFSSVLLASRLPTEVHVFVFVLLAIQLFALYPLLRDFIRVRSDRGFLWLTAILSVVTLALLLTRSPLLAAVYVAGVLFVSFVCPWWLLGVQKYKNEISGPWDIAHIVQYTT